MEEIEGNPWWERRVEKVDLRKSSNGGVAWLDVLRIDGQSTLVHGVMTEVGRCSSARRVAVQGSKENAPGALGMHI
jgi:hypothetical protein